MPLGTGVGKILAGSTEGQEQLGAEDCNALAETRQNQDQKREGHYSSQGPWETVYRPLRLPVAEGSQEWPDDSQQW